MHCTAPARSLAAHVCPKTRAGETHCAPRGPLAAHTMAASMRGLAQGLTRFQLPGAARLTLEERYARANADLDALERPDDDESFFAWATGPLVAKVLRLQACAHLRARHAQHAHNARCPPTPNGPQLCAWAALLLLLRR